VSNSNDPFISQLIELFKNRDFITKIKGILKTDSGSPTDDYVTEQSFDGPTFSIITANSSSFIDEIFQLLNSSILHGEYFTLTNIDELKTNLILESKEFLISIKNELTSFPAYYNNTEIVWKTVEISINEFVVFVDSVRNKVSSKKKIFYPLNLDNNFFLSDFKYLESDEESYSKNLYYTCLKLYRLFRINLSSSRNEFLLQSADFEKLLADLLSDINWINKIINQIALSDAIWHKCFFLWRKITLRIKYESNDDIVFWDGNKEINLTADEKNDPFKGWINTIWRHYELTNDSKKQTVDLVTGEKLQNAELNDLTYTQLHLLIKYYKDCTENDYIEELTKIRKEFNRRYTLQDASQTFNSFATSFDYNYSVNNEFSSLLDHINHYQNVTQLYIEVSKVQEITGIDNFFPQWKYLKYLLQKVKIKIDENVIFEKIESVKFFLKEANTIFTKYDKNIYWSQKTYNYVFYLPVEECFVDFEDSNKLISKIFIASSFVLPLVKNRYIEEYEQARQQLINLEKSVEVLTVIHEQQSEIKRKNEQLEAEIKGKETKYIEILGIFASIITFAAAAFTAELNIGKGQSFQELFRGLFCIGIVLFLFVLALLFVTRIPFEKIWNKTNSLNLRKFSVACIIAIITIIITIAINFLIFNYYYNIQSQKKVPPIKATSKDSLGSTSIKKG
jgi:hypothetical protein